jgi:hypothetical protein
MVLFFLLSCLHLSPTTPYEAGQTIGTAAGQAAGVAR